MVLGEGRASHRFTWAVVAHSIERHSDFVAKHRNSTIRLLAGLIQNPLPVWSKYSTA
jgi:hypothetical protein